MPTYSHLSRQKWPISLDNEHKKEKSEGNIRNFIFRNLKPAIDDINQLTSMQIEYFFVRDGRKYQDIRFFVREWDNVTQKNNYLQWENECLEGKRDEESKRIIEACLQSCKQRLQTGEGEIIIEKIEEME